MSVVSAHGFEPRFPDPKSGDLPLVEAGMVLALFFLSACSGPFIQVGSQTLPLVQVGPSTQPAPATPPAIFVSGCEWAKPIIPDVGYLKRWTFNEQKQEDKFLKTRDKNCPLATTPKPRAK